MITITIRQDGIKSDAESMKVEVEKLKEIYPDAKISYIITETI
jgi:hypothetical protein